MTMSYPVTPIISRTLSSSSSSPQANAIQLARARRDRVLLATFSVATFLLWSSFYHRHLETIREQQIHQQYLREQSNSKSRSRVLRSAERNLRFLTFGSTTTWGQGLRNRQREAFPFLLSSNDVDNYASSYGGAALPAVCTQSIVGDDAKYDVIVLEYSPQQIDNGLSVLSKRLRQRYPNATMVFVRLWSPSANLRYQLNETVQISADEWRQTMGKSSSSLLRGRKVPKESLLSTDATKWSLQLEETTRLRELVESVNGYIYSLPSPQPSRAMDVLSNYIDLFQDEDWSQLSPLGHSIVAQGIQNLVQKNLPPSPLSQHVLGSWGSGDACALWQASGLSTTLSSEQNRRRRRLRNNNKSMSLQFSPESTRRIHFGGHRHAVEIGSSVASFVVTNPFDEERMLYLTYMTALRPSSTSSKVYPQIQISLGNKPSVIVNPIYTLKHNHDPKQSQQQPSHRLNVHHHHHHHHHRARTTPIGVVPPGETIIKMEALETTLNRFRLTGVSFLGSLQVPVEFALESDVVHEESDGLRRFFTV